MLFMCYTKLQETLLPNVIQYRKGYPLRNLNVEKQPSVSFMVRTSATTLLNVRISLYFASLLFVHVF